MEVNDLKEYLKIVVDLEKNNYLQEQLMESLCDKISTLGLPKHFPPIIPPKAPRLISPLFYVLAVVGTVIAAFILCIPVGMVAVLFEQLEDALTLIFIGLTILIFLVLSFCIWNENSQRTKVYAEQRESYERNIEKYQNTLLQEKERVAFEEKQKEVLQADLHQLEKQNKSTKQTLADVYSLNIIYGKYRTFPYVCLLCEYICSKRCSTLEGSGGAYNILEQEDLQKNIILRLDQVIERLDSIKANQYMLYNAIQETNQKLYDILAGVNLISEKIRYIPSQQQDISQYLEELQKNSAVTAYSTERIEKEISYMNRMNYFAGKYDDAGMFRNMPPS